MKQLLSILPAALLFVSCEKQAEPAAVKPDSSVTGFVSPEPQWSDADYTEWMSRAELQYTQDLSPSEQYFAFVEGRNNNGVAEFRAVKRDLPTEQYSQWAVFWGIDQKSFSIGSCVFYAPVSRGKPCRCSLTQPAPQSTRLSGSDLSEPLITFPRKYWKMHLSSSLQSQKCPSHLKTSTG